MSCRQLALNGSNLEESIAVYSSIFKSAPTKVRPGHANFAVSDPPFKPVLTENPAETGSINHLGVGVFSAQAESEGRVPRRTRTGHRGRDAPPVASRGGTRCGSMDLTPRSRRTTRPSPTPRPNPRRRP